NIKYNNEIKKIESDMIHKINMVNNIPLYELKKSARPAIRKLFSYEIIDRITEYYGGEYVTVAWMKCYEIISKFKLLDDIKDNVVNYFGICEQPGAFVYAINHYVKTNTNKQFDFIIESLVD